MAAPRRIAGGIVLGLGLLLLAAAGWLYLDGCEPAAGSTATPIPRPTATPLPSFTPYVPPTLTPLPPGVALRVTCNAPAALQLVDGAGQEVARGNCTPKWALKWQNLPRGPYILHISSAELDLQMERRVDLYREDNETAVLFPGVLEIAPVPASATVEVDGTIYHGLTRLTYPAEQCPISTTVWVEADGYNSYGTILVMQGGKIHRQEVVLEPLPTPVPPTAVPPHPTPPPAAPTTPPFTVEERVELVRQKLYDSVNCIRAEAGLGPLPFVTEWRPLADDFARGWRDHFTQYGVEGFDSSPWRQQLQAAGGDAVPDWAGLPLYVPDHYFNMASRYRWETFNMCDPNCPMYHYFFEQTSNITQASGVIIGMAPWWDGDILSAAVVIGFKW
jgi:hypothetical protein